MELNYEKRYAYAEVEEILNWLGENYIKKVPQKILRTIKEEKKFGYRPEIDFTKPIENQIRQETKNIIAYLDLNFWETNENEKQLKKEVIAQNAKEEKERKRQERMREMEMKARIASTGTVTSSIDNALKQNSEKNN